MNAVCKLLLFAKLRAILVFTRVGFICFKTSGLNIINGSNHQEGWYNGFCKSVKRHSSTNELVAELQKEQHRVEFLNKKIYDGRESNKQRACQSIKDANL
jgi:hypothetical protein